MNEIVVAVGSKNPVKLGATLKGFQAVWPVSNIIVKSVKFSSDVSKQPMSNKEMVKGACYRAQKALELSSNAIYGVGLEGGAYKIGNDWFETGCIVIVDRSGKMGVGFSISMEIPKNVFRLLKEGKRETLGEVMDFVFKVKKCAKNQGFFGLMTNNAITRTSAYKDAVISALGPWIHPEVF